MNTIRRMCMVLAAAAMLLLQSAAAVCAEDAMPDRKVIFIGDSRTVEMYGNVNQENIYYELYQADKRGDFWSCMIGAKYDWMTGTGVPIAEMQLDGYSAVVFLMGVNDCCKGTSAGMAMQYADYINMKAEEWSAYGTETYFVSVNPVDGDYQFYEVLINNTSISQFNAVMQAQLSDKVTYIDTYSQILDTFVSPDRLHYEHDTYLDIYHIIMSALAEDLPEKDASLQVGRASDPAQKAEKLQMWHSASSATAKDCSALLYGGIAGLLP